jgi:hypothetical protein
VPRGKSIPDPGDVNYRYSPKPAESPPITEHEFRRRFNACYDRCLASRISAFRHFHKCRSPCRHSQDALSRIPKRLRDLEESGDKREIFWGIIAKDRISVVKVVIYHILILCAPFLFCFLWLFSWGHSGDLQNASVPAVMTVSLLSMFWYPLAGK